MKCQCITTFDRTYDSPRFFKRVSMECIIQNRGTKLVLLMITENNDVTVDFLLGVLVSLKDSDSFEEYRSILHSNLSQLELWQYYIEYCVETQRITEILDSLEYLKKKSAIGENIILLYNKLASFEIRNTILKNQ